MPQNVYLHLLQRRRRFAYSRVDLDPIFCLKRIHFTPNHWDPGQKGNLCAHPLFQAFKKAVWLNLDSQSRIHLSLLIGIRIRPAK